MGCRVLHVHAEGQYQGELNAYREAGIGDAMWARMEIDTSSGGIKRGSRALLSLRCPIEVHTVPWGESVITLFERWSARDCARRMSAQPTRSDTARTESRFRCARWPRVYASASTD
jgi:hypothetical protein